jgi:hypothetical protein
MSLRPRRDGDVTPVESGGLGCFPVALQPVTGHRERDLGDVDAPGDRADPVPGEWLAGDRGTLGSGQDDRADGAGRGTAVDADQPEPSERRSAVDHGRALGRLDRGENRIVIAGGPHDEPVDGGGCDPEHVIGGTGDRTMVMPYPRSAQTSTTPARKVRATGTPKTPHAPSRS